NRADVRMIHCRGGFRFSSKPLDGDGVPRDLWGETFEGDGPMEANVFGLVNYPHSPATELFQDSVVRNNLTGVELRFGHLKATAWDIARRGFPSKSCSDPIQLDQD
ncbi:MAG TPA: hypothetical protein VF749_12625, partial [Candidatus Acidoferrum sp.]